MFQNSSKEDGWFFSLVVTFWTTTSIKMLWICSDAPAVPYFFVFGTQGTCHLPLHLGRGVMDVYERKGGCVWPDEDLLMETLPNKERPLQSLVPINHTIQHNNKEANILDDLADNQELCVFSCEKSRDIQPLIAVSFDAAVSPGCRQPLWQEFADKKRQYQHWFVFHIAERFFFWHRLKCWIKTVWSGSLLTGERSKSNDGIFCTEEQRITQL